MKCHVCGAERNIPEIPAGQEGTFCPIARNKRGKIVPCCRLGTDKERWCADCPVMLGEGETKDRQGRRVA